MNSPGRMPFGPRGGRASAAVLASLLAALTAFSGCASGDKTLFEADPEAAPLEPTYSQVVSILDRNCIPCHSDGSGERENDDPSFDTCEGIQAALADLARTAIDEGSMPPGAWPRLDERERLTLRRWISQGACSPCTNCP